MKLYSGRITRIAEELVRSLVDAEAIEVHPESMPEAQLDAESVMREYIRTEREIAQRARQMADEGRGTFGRIKRMLAAQSGFKTGDESIDYIVNQLIETFLHSNHVEEVYADDLDLRKRMSTIIKRNTRDLEDQLDEQVRSRIQNLQEGSAAWEDEYSRVLGQLKRTRKLQ